ncbi:MAG: glycosyltransferase family 2 protein [Caldilinea sp.]|nr:glycosyltransferase family 2 protein [Caldilinea sp.]MCB0055879.1 glycosyltransferase family 2 protein [Caldilineaceae bacterium]MCB0051631.1 glycosyltransferase family 2 protein [Caldilinea sp.]MCB0068695.1 glycosyltransferase family 2 protein [Caldilineaceae bacterium]MCB0146221.1 glycosyltransferase family 2 protein [Caldilineaceae bacterium]
MDVTAVVVSFNTCSHLERCLASIYATQCQCELIVIDNASTDGSSAMVRANFPAAMLVENQCNIGYAAAANQGARLASGRYLLLLNPDTVVEDDAIERLAAFMDAHPEIGICAPQNRNGEDHELFGEQGAVQNNYFHFPSFQGLAGLGTVARRHLGLSVVAPPEPPPFVERDGSILADWLRGCTLFVRSGLYRRLGGMDEGFFLYLEDTDLCRRVRQAGLHCAVVTDATIVHYGGASYREESVPRIKTMLAPHFLRSKYHYVRQERGRIGECSVRLTDLILGLSGLLRRKESATSRMRIAESLRPGSRSTVRHRMALARSIAHS